MRKTLHRLWRKLSNPSSGNDTERFHDALQIGDAVGPDHRVTGYLGAGGFGYTYTAQRADGVRVALKECFPVEFCRRTGTDVGLRAQDEAEALDAIRTRFSEEA